MAMPSAGGAGASGRLLAVLFVVGLWTIDGVLKLPFGGLMFAAAGRAPIA
jgi:hypothetical protein